ncbi:MAG: hypothetical protein ACE5OS_14985 [Anaerolineae bacterium]
MKAVILIALLFGTGVMLSGCGARNVTPAQDRSLKSAILRDVHPLWGGRNVYLFGDGRLFVQMVARGAQESRYALQVEPARVEELARLLREHRFMQIEIEDRPGMPDEARPEIEVVWQSGARKAVARWANDTHPDFDAIYSWLVELAESATGQTPVYVGPYEEDWRPE